METLTDEVWDVVIAGTSLPQSLLALSLSRAGKKVLHVDRNNYYGGQDAGFSLNDAESWVQEISAGDSRLFSEASISKASDATPPTTATVLRPSRSYTLSLNPQIIYAQSSFLPSLVSSQIHTQLEFLAVGSWWVLRDGALQKIPSTREDVFSDDTLSMRDKRSLMRFLRSVLQPEEQDQPRADPLEPANLKQALQQRFNIADSLHSPIQALALLSTSANETDFEVALQRIRRHMRSIGYFGPGFGAVIAKYGGTAEIAQVACRAQAVGGGIYLLSHGVDTINDVEDPEHGKLLHVKLSDGTLIRSRRVVGATDAIPDSALPPSPPVEKEVKFIHSISIVSDPLKSLFPPTSENGTVPAAAIVLVESANSPGQSPVYLQIHSEDSGECPSNQCIVYASVRADSETFTARLRSSVDDLLTSCASESTPAVLWNLTYNSRTPESQSGLHLDDLTQGNSNILTLPTRPFDIALDDAILDITRTVWKWILESEAEGQEFLRFEERQHDTDVADDA